jgi:hypothetical protein
VAIMVVALFMLMPAVRKRSFKKDRPRGFWVARGNQYY